MKLQLCGHTIERILEQKLINFSEDNCGHNCRDYTLKTIDRYNSNILFHIEEAKTNPMMASHHMNRAIPCHYINGILKRTLGVEQTKQENLAQVLSESAQENYLK